MLILSKSNPIIKDTYALKQKKTRNQTGLAILEGIKVIKEAQISGIEILRIFIDKDVSFDLSSFDSSVIIETSQDIIKYLSSQITPQGIIAVIKQRVCTPKKPENNFIVLDNVQDPSNIGAIIRSALATDFKDIYTINCCDIYNEKVLRASMGTIFRCNIYDVSYEDLSKLKLENLYIADMKGQNVFDAGFKNFPVGLIVGNEGHGISNEIRNMVTNLISIPMANNVESLNVSVSAGIIMYQISNKMKEK